jgi:hypothetical protein
MTRSGDKVTITNNQEKTVFVVVKLGQSITFTVGSVGGKPALLNIQGVRTLGIKGYKDKTQYGPSD